MNIDEIRLDILNYIQEFTFCDNGYLIIYLLTGIYVFFINKLRTELYHMEHKIFNLSYNIDYLNGIKENNYIEKETQYEIDVNLNKQTRLLYLDNSNYNRKEFNDYIKDNMFCEYILLGDTYEDCENILDVVFNYQPNLIIIAKNLNYKEKKYCGIDLMNKIKNEYNEKCKILIRSNDFNDNQTNLFEDKKFDDFIPCKLRF
jgi:hypothetical protein